MKPSGGPAWATWTLAAVAALLALRVVALALDYGRDSLQMDFAAFWVAGEAVTRGLSPYENHVGDDPALWDGVAAYRHSRFLYPPLVARGFQPLAALPYHVAKRVWMAIALAALAAALTLLWRAWGRGAGPRGALALAAIAAGFFPVLALLERGQVDSVTLALIAGAVALRRRSGVGAGLLLATATMLKLHCGFLLPFVMLRGWWRVAAGFAAGVVLWAGLGAVVDGPAAWRQYVDTEMPRIARRGEGGARADRLPPHAFARALAGVTPGRTAVDGREYAPSTLDFVLNASAVRTPLGRAVWNGLRGAGLDVAPGHVSLVLLAAVLAGVGALGWRRGAPPDRVGVPLALTAVLLCAPVTWAMGTVWLLAAAPALLAWFADGQTGRATTGTAVAAVLVGAGLALAAAPDPFLSAAFADGVAGALRFKYLAAEALVVAGLLAAWSTGGATPRNGVPDSRPDRRD